MTRARRGTEQELEWRVTAYLFLGPASSSESHRDAGQKSSQRPRVLEPGLEGSVPGCDQHLSGRGGVGDKESERGLRPAVPCHGTHLGAHLLRARLSRRGAAAVAAESSKPITTVGAAAIGLEHANSSWPPQIS